MVGHDEHRGPKRRLVTPPALPSVIGPITLLGTKFAPSHDLGPDALAPQRGQSTVDGDRCVDTVDPVDEASVETTE